MKIKFYGSRGTIPFFSRDNVAFGGNTSCVRIDHEGETLLIDCGSGLLQYLAEEKQAGRKTPFKRTDILISHLHLDHIIGLPAFGALWKPNNNIRIFTKSRNNAPLAKQVFGAFAPPYWPVDLSKNLCADLVGIANEEFIVAGGIRVQTFASHHLDGTTAFKLTTDKTLIYLLDCELDEAWPGHPALLEFCAGADAIIFDASYLPADYPRKQGWGHSTYQHGLRLAQQTGCRQMIFSHFSPCYSDTMLESVQTSIEHPHTLHLAAYDGMELTL